MKLRALMSTRILTLLMPDNKHKESMNILLTTWNSSHTNFSLSEMSYLLESTSNLSLTAQWVKHTCVALHHAASLSLNLNSSLVIARGKHKNLTENVTPKNTSVKNFCLTKAHKKVLNSKKKFNGTKHMRAEVNLLASVKFGTQEQKLHSPGSCLHHRVRDVLPRAQIMVLR